MGISLLPRTWGAACTLLAALLPAQLASQAALSQGRAGAEDSTRLCIMFTASSTCFLCLARGGRFLCKPEVGILSLQAMTSLMNVTRGSDSREELLSCRSFFLAH